MVAPPGVPLRKLRDILSEKDINQSELQNRTGISNTTIGKAIKGVPVSRRTADRIAHAIGTPTPSLIDMPSEQEKVPLKLTAGQREVIEYPQSNGHISMLEARLNLFERELKSMREMMQTIADSMEEISTRPIKAPVRTMVLSEYE